MKTDQTLSEIIRKRRNDLGLSLSAVARRAGTSAATLSRYEHGWSRFEVHTLQKMATALECSLQIHFVPLPKPQNKRPNAAKLTAQLGRLFWDRPLLESDLTHHKDWVFERVLEYGDLEDVHMLRNFTGHAKFIETVASLRRLSPRTAAFWQQILKQEGYKCTNEYSRSTVLHS